MKKLFAVILSAAMVFSLAACGGNSKPSESTSNDQSTGSLSQEATSGVKKDSYPIVDETITLKIAAAVPSYTGDFAEMKFWKELEELTNIHVEWEQVVEKQEEFFNLMVASEDYRDVTFKTLSDSTMEDLIEADAIYCIDDYMEYAPNYAKVFEQFPEGRKTSVMSDGKLYGFPLVREEPSSLGIRDQWLINQQWLTELGLEMPKTVDDFYNVLKAFKDNAGKGTIPKDVIPWYLKWDQYSNGGQFELFNAFGVFTPGNFSGNRYISIGEDKKVDFTANDPRIKEPLKFMNKLYSEGLIPPDAFTGAKTFESMVTSATPVVGSFLKYFNTDETHKVWAPMPPLTSENNPDGIFRRQINGFTRNRATIYKVNKHPEATVRWLDTIGDPEWSVQANYGMFDGEFMKKEGDKYIQLPFEGNEVYENVPGPILPLIITPETANKIEYNGGQADRAKTIEEVYSAHTYPVERYYPNVVWTEEEMTKRKDLETDIKDYISSTFAKWITEGGIDEGWDAYVAQLDKLGINDLLAVYQQAYDRFNQ